jgi:hypothetical protein
MQDDYLSFLEFRAAQRRLAARFSQPHALMLHTLIFVTTLTAMWVFGLVWRLWLYRGNFDWPTLLGAGWSVLLAAHALFHYRRSSAMGDRRELAVEDEMRQLIEKSEDQIDHESLFAMHRSLAAGLERQGRWALALLAFGLVNAASWVVSAINMGTSWPFQTTIPLALLTIGGVSAYATWQQHRREKRDGWFARLPLRHVVAYGAGSIGLVLAALLRLINPWDAETLIAGWGVLLVLHMVVAVVVWPLIRRFLPDTLHQEQPAKRKPGARLVLADDGEMLNVIDGDSERFQAHRRA